MRLRAYMVWLFVLGIVVIFVLSNVRRNYHNYEGPFGGKPVFPPSGNMKDWPLMSQLPIVVVDTLGKRIPDEPKIPARLKIIHNRAGGTNFPGSSHVAFEGKIGIEVRGKTSQMYPKKQYGLELSDENGTAREASLLQLPAESDWILNGPFADKSLMRNFLAYEFSNRIGRYAPRALFVELLLNNTGEAELQKKHYAGIYLLLEKIKRGKSRVNIPKGERSGGSGSGPVDYGGFIVKIDKMDRGDSSFISAFGTRFIHVYPKAERMDGAQKAWLANCINRFETALHGPDFDDPKRGYAHYIDVGSFVDYFILNELFKNIDAYRISTFLHRDAKGKLQMGPIWDFDLAMGNAEYNGAWRPKGWVVDAFSSGVKYKVPFWWKRLLSDPNFRRQLATRWKTLRGEVLTQTAMLDTIDRTTRQLDEARRRNFEKWPVLGRYIRPNPSPYAPTYEEEIRQLKTWLQARLHWMDQQMQNFH